MLRVSYQTSCSEKLFLQSRIFHLRLRISPSSPSPNTNKTQQNREGEAYTTSFSLQNVRKKVDLRLSGFRHVRALVAGVEPATDGPLQILGWVRYPLCFLRPKDPRRWQWGYHDDDDRGDGDDDDDNDCDNDDNDDDDDHDEDNNNEADNDDGALAA
ncbi:hypothetical protein PoB_000080400 [Plakobranchus ocellatus]|uniref:Uncharacterized protein n=1 Tax=Plakobranchus ocellatus TaxID=259542 RepID=A0AAV3XWK0_9GAST|nr:hypothetical protein PoB_000080400 [Plakobranchus ocellatus]